MDKKDLAQDKKMIKSAVKQHDAQKHKGSKPTTVMLKKGGPTSLDRKTYGKNMSRAMNQRGG
jgi:hypothetical protein